MTEAIAVEGYQIESELGRGGMGVVFKARQTNLNRVVALKMVLGAGDANAISRFLVEAEAVAAIRHPHVVQVYDYGQTTSGPFMALEYLPGGTLADRLKGEFSFEPRRAAELLAKIARGVQAAHSQGTIHRDIKPGNVLFDESGEPKIADFGLAKRADSDITRTGAVMGTPAYMAPEQASGRTKFVGPTADIWALGVILYECILACRPFEADTTDVLLNKIILDEPVTLRARNPRIPPDLEAICLRCPEKEVSRRYPSASELADDLDRFLAGEPISAVRSGLIRRVAGSIDRVRLNERFAEYGTLMLALAPVMLLSEVWITVGVLNDWPWHWLAVGNTARAVAFLAALGAFRHGQFWPRGVLERQLWAIWGGYFVVCYAFGMSTLAGHMDQGPRLMLDQYQGVACLTAFAFFVMAPTIWGYCAVIGTAYLLLSFIMAVDLRWAPLEFGVLWVVVLSVFGLRLRQLGKLATPQG